MSRHNRWIADSGRAGFDRERMGIKLDRLWGIKDAVAEQRAGKHDVYWGCHACNLKKGHIQQCVCSCGAHPQRFSITWGDDAKEYTPVQKKRRNKMMSKNEPQGITYVTIDLRSTVINGRYRKPQRNIVRRIKVSRKSGTKTGYSG